MNLSDGREYVKESCFGGFLLHGTDANSAEKIKRNGISPAHLSNFVAFAKGYCGARSAEYAMNFGSVLLTQMFLFKNPFRFGCLEDFQEWIQVKQLHLHPDSLRHAAASLVLINEGYDSIFIDSDNPDFTDSRAIVVFHPMQVVTIDSL